MDPTAIAAAAAISIGGNGILGLVVWGLKSQIRADLAELENRIINRLNGTYVRSGVCAAYHEGIKERLEHIEGRLENL